LALLKSVILQLKTGVINRFDDAQLSIYKALDYAREAEIDLGKSHVGLVTELDRLVTYYWNHIIHHPQGTWVTEFKNPDIDYSSDANKDTFISLAIENGLNLYLVEVIDEDAAEEKQGQPLLDYALFPSPQLLASRTILPDVELVSSLLHHGADPNQVFEMGSSWQKALCFVKTEFGQPSVVSRLRQEEWSLWAKLLAMLLRYGADQRAFSNMSNTALSLLVRL
jgi:hypothetical protein